MICVINSFTDVVCLVKQLIVEKSSDSSAIMNSILRSLSVIYGSVC